MDIVVLASATFESQIFKASNCESAKVLLPPRNKLDSFISIQEIELRGSNDPLPTEVGVSFNLSSKLFESGCTT